MRPRSLTVLVLIAAGAGFASRGEAVRAAEPFTLVVRGGLVYDGTGGPPRRADVGVRGDRIAVVGDLSSAEAKVTLDARERAVAPGFINMLSWSTESLLVDGRSLGEVRQGVTTQIFGEGESYGPWTEEMKKLRRESQGDVQYEIGDRATFEKPHQYAVGVQHVVVNGVPVLRDGEPTGATPGRALKGPGARP